MVSCDVIGDGRIMDKKLASKRITHDYVLSIMLWYSYRMQLNTSILNTATAFLTFTVQVLGNVIPCGETSRQALRLVTARYDSQRSTNESREM